MESHAEAVLLQKALERGADAIVVSATPAAVTDLGAGSRVPPETVAGTLVLFLHPAPAAEPAQAIVATACAYFLDTVAIDAIAQVVGEVHERSCSTGVQRSPAPASAPEPLLSSREKRILALLAQEKTSKEIAALLGISSRTVDVHRSKLIKKLGVHGTVGLACYAVAAGLVRA